MKFSVLFLRSTYSVTYLGYAHVNTWSGYTTWTLSGKNNYTSILLFQNSNMGGEAVSVGAPTISGASITQLCNVTADREYVYVGKLTSLTATIKFTANKTSTGGDWSGIWVAVGLG